MVDVSSLQHLSDAESLLRMVEDVVLQGEKLRVEAGKSEFPWRGVNLALKNAVVQLEKTLPQPLELAVAKSGKLKDDQNPIKSSNQHLGEKSRKRSSVLDRIQPLPLKNSTANSGF